jgi:hypothetical protein
VGAAQEGGRFSANARIPSWPSSPAKNPADSPCIAANRSAIEPVGASSSNCLVAASAPGAPSRSIPT